MSAKNLIAQFEQIAEAPEAPQKIRDLVFGLAVRGHLVPQSGDDVPAERLIRAIIEGKADRSKLGRLKKSTVVEDAPFALPASWAWAQTDDLCAEIVDCPHSTPKFTSSGVVCLDTNSFKDGVLVTEKLRFVSEETYKDRVKRLTPQPGDVVFAREGSVGESVLIPEGFRCCLGQRVMLFRPGPGMDAEYFRLALSEPSALARLVVLHKGIGARHVNVKDMRRAILPVPPSSEQQRIVQRVKEVIRLCEEMEVSRRAREGRRDRLVIASQRRMIKCAPDTEAFHKGTTFYLERLPRLTSRLEHVSELRRTIIDLAVRGKLVAQDPNDEPGEKLLARVEKEKRRQVDCGELKEPKFVPPATEGDIGFHLPPNWTSTRLGTVAGCLDYRREPVNVSERNLRIQGKRPGALTPYYGATQQQGWIDDFIFDEELVLLGEDGVPFFDNLRRKAYVISGKSWVNNHAHVFRGILVDNQFLAHYLNVFDYKGRVAGATRSKLNQSKALDIPVPLPPLEEQKRITVKVDGLLTICDGLEIALREGSAKRSQLLAAVIHEVLH